MSIRARNVFLLLSTVLAWLGCGHFLAMVAKHDNRLMLAWLMIMLFVAGLLTTACLLSLFVKPLARQIAAAQHVYRAGYQAGRTSTQRAATPEQRRAQIKIVPLRQPASRTYGNDEAMTN